MKKTLTVLTLASSTLLTADDTKILPPVPVGAQAISLFGTPLMPSAPSQATLEKYEAAKATYDTDPNNVDNIIWYGRRTAYKGDYREAIRIYSEGIEKFPFGAKRLHVFAAEAQTIHAAIDMNSSRPRHAIRRAETGPFLDLLKTIENGSDVGARE